MTEFALLLVVLAVGPEARTDLDALQGKWMIVAITVNGDLTPGDRIKGLELEIKGDKYLVTRDGQTASRTIKLDPTKKPKAVDITYDDGPNKGKTSRAIYALEGDTWKICRHEQPEMDRPKAFDAAADSGRALVVWKKVK